MKYTKAFQKRARGLGLTPAMLAALDSVAWSSTATWWHDVGAATARALLKRGLIEECFGGLVACGRPGCVHPGYVIATDKGFSTLGITKG